MVTEQQLRDRLRAVEDPELGVDIVSLGLVTNVRIDHETDLAVVSLAFNAPLSPAEWSMCDEVRALCRGVGLEPRIHADTAGDRGRFSGIKNSIAIGSAEPGAGVSLVTANLAMALASIGARVGVLDVRLESSRDTWLDVIDPPDLSADRIVPRTVRGISVVRLGPVVPSCATPPGSDVVLELTVPTVVESMEWGPIDYLLVALPRGVDRNSAVVLEQVPTDGTIAVSSVDSSSAPTRSLVEDLTALGSTVIGVLETAEGEETDGSGVERDWQPTELGPPHLGIVPLDRSTLAMPGEPRTGPAPETSRWTSTAAMDESPFRDLALSITDRIGAVNRQCVTERQLP